MASKTIKGLTVEIGGDTTKLSKALKDVEAKSRSLSKELGDINKLLKLDPGNMDLLAQKQEVLAQAAAEAAKKLDTLKEAERQVQEQFKRGEVSEEQLRALQREIVATENKMKGYEKAAKQTAEAMEDVGDGAEESGDEAKKAAGKVDDFADAADEAEKASGELGKTLNGAVVAGLKAVAALAAAAITGLVAAAEGTREYRTEMGKLDAAFTASGHSSETAAAAYRELYGVIGETDQSVEAAQQIALLARSEEDVAKWAGLASGVVGRFGDALQPETFFEAANETLKLNEATSAYVQLLEQTGYSVDTFNAGLAACATEQEKQAYMLQITEQLLGEAGAAYEANNAEIIRANQATDSWMQSLAGAGGAVEPLVTDVKLLGASLLGEAVPAIKAMSDALRGVLNGEDGAAADLGAALSGMVSSLIQKITEMLPTVVQVGVSLVSTLASALVSQLPQILSTGGQIISQLVAGIQTYLPLVLAKGAELLGKLGEGIRQNLPGFVSQALDILMNFAQTIYDNAPVLIETGFKLLSDLVAGIMSSLPTLIAKAPEIISTFANTINDNFPTILAKGVQLIGHIVMGIIKAIPTLVANIPKIITAIVDVWEAFNWLNLGKKAITWLKDGVLKMLSAVKSAGKTIMTGCTDALKNLPQNLLNLGKTAVSDLAGSIRNGLSTVKSGAKSIFDGVVNTFKNLPSSLVSVGKDLVRGLWNGISDMSGWVIGKIQGFCSNALSSIKSFFGIKSPSRVLRDQVGAMLAQGMAIGLEDNADAPITAMEHVSRGVLDAAQDINGLQVERSVQSRTVASQAAAASSAGIGGKLDAILAAIERGQVIALDSKLLIGATADGYDNTLGQRRALVARGAL